jgi:hypothetical protein
MEFVWHPSASLGDKAEMFAHVLHTHYSAPQVSSISNEMMFIVTQGIRLGRIFSTSYQR